MDIYAAGIIDRFQICKLLDYIIRGCKLEIIMVYYGCTGCKTVVTYWLYRSR